MRLIKILDLVTQIEKSSFLKIIDNLASGFRSSNSEIDKILSEGEDQIRNIDNANIFKLFNLTKDGFSNLIDEKLQYNDYHLDILIDIMIRDGNSIMTREWLSKLYSDEIKNLESHMKSFTAQLGEDRKEIDTSRKRDYVIYNNCVNTAFYNDEQQNREKIISRDEKSILNTLADSLELSIEEVRMIYYSIVGISKIDIDIIINSLKELGIIFLKRKTNTIYIPDEIIWLLRDLVGIELSNKYFRRILRQLRDSEINRICKKHNIDLKLTREEKIRQVLKQGISVRSVLLQDIYRDKVSKSEKKEFLQDLIGKKLDIKLSRHGTTAEERLDKLIEYFQDLEKDENIGISIDGYDKLLKDLNTFFPEINQIVKEEFELQQEFVMTVELMSDYNIKPRDILVLLPKPELAKFCEECSIKTRGNISSNILGSYKDIKKLYLENYELFGKRDFNALKEKGIEIKESEIGVKYEQLTKVIFKELGYDVDEKLRRKINTKRAQVDIILNLGKNEVIIVECKTIKDRDYNKYASVSRQLKAYEKLCEKNGYRVLQIILVSNDFTEDFIADCEYDYELNLSLVSSTGFLRILNGFKRSCLDMFPTKLFLKGGKLNEDRIVMALNR